jgi:hypothetical protein
MAGTLTISTLSDGTNSTSSTNCIQGSAKAWVNYNGSGQAIRGSYNVSSVTYSAAGQYIINMTTALANANYCISAACGTTGSALTWISVNANQSNARVTPTTSAFTVAVTGGNNPLDVCLSVFN